MNRKDCADRHSSKRDTFFNFGFKNRSEKKEIRAKAKKFGFVTSITIKEDIWPELEVLQMKNKLALSLLLHPPRDTLALRVCSSLKNGAGPTLSPLRHL